MVKKISSIQNPLIKRILALKDKAKLRRKEGVFVVEGRREVSLAKQGGFQIQTLCFVPEMFDQNQVKSFSQEGTELVQISNSVYEKLAYRGSTEGVLALVNIKSTTLENLKLKSNTPLILVAESPEKPGNIGALLRTADAVKADAVLIADPTTDLFNPNVVRSSVGGLFSTPVAVGTSREIIHFLDQHKIGIYSAILQDSVRYDTIDFCTASAIVVGPESTGLSAIWRSSATQCIHIPMLGTLDSMNVSVAAGILLFEAQRQRSFK